MVRMEEGEEEIGLPNGDFHLLAIGINKYLHHSHLKTAVNDATKFSELMQAKYGFKKENCTLLVDEDATADQIDESIRKYLPNGTKSLTDQDFLLVWFSGHGEDDEDGSRRTYFIPHDGGPNKRVSSWVDFERVKGYFSNIKARQILLVSDSCFSGGALRKIQADLSSHPDSYISRVIKRRGRQAITSGGLEEVDDSGFGSHSIFADVFIEKLIENEKFGISAGELFEAIKEPVTLNSEQTPKFGTLYKTGSHGGEFVFFNLNHSVLSNPIDRPSSPMATQQYVDVAEVTFEHASVVNTKKYYGKKVTNQIKIYLSELEFYATNTRPRGPQKIEKFTYGQGVQVSKIEVLKKCGELLSFNEPAVLIGFSNGTSITGHLKPRVHSIGVVNTIPKNLKLKLGAKLFTIDVEGASFSGDEFLVEIRSPFEGRLKTDIRKSGSYVEIQNGNESFFFHLIGEYKKIFVKSGQWVKRGQPLATSKPGLFATTWGTL